MRTPQKSKWQSAIDSELKGLDDTGCYEETRLPPNTKAIFAQWVLTVKTDSFGNIIKYKARCTCRGDMIPAKMNTDISYPVASWTGIRLFLALPTLYELKPLQLDINLAYLNAPLKEEVYMYPHLAQTLRRDSYGDSKRAPMVFARAGETGISSSSTYSAVTSSDSHNTQETVAYLLAYEVKK